LEVYDDGNKLYQDIAKLKKIKNEFKGENFTSTLLLVYFSFFQFCSSSSSYAFPYGFASSNEKFDNNSISGGISFLFCKKTWHIITLILAKTYLMKFLFVQYTFMFLPLRYSSFSLVVYYWILLQHFSISKCVTLIHSITSTMILLFLFAPSSTKVKTFDQFHFTLVLVGVIRVVELLVGVDGMSIRFRKLENGLPWLKHEKSLNFK
jgi:hypothetical protein